MSKKKAAPYVPVWDGPIAGYATNQVHKAKWRVALTHEHEDLMQEARIVFLKCERAYPVLDTAQHFMALYKTALLNRFNDLSNKNSKLLPVSMNDDWTELRVSDGWKGEQLGDTNNDGYLMSLIRQAPREVSMVLALFLNAPAELLEVAEQSWRNGRGGKRNLNAMVRRLLGPDVGEKPVEQVEAYFQRD